MNEFMFPAIGGVLIGLSATVLLLFNGRIAGISGLLWGAVADLQSSLWRYCFLIGLLLGGFLAHQCFDIPIPALHDNTVRAIAGGLLVGFGVKLGSGCTSGHGVCGIGRLSPRSIVATLIFTATAIVVVSMGELLR